MKKTQAPLKLTRAQKRVLDLLKAGAVMLPAGKDELGGVIFGRNDCQEIRVSGKVVSFLFSEGLISVGDIYVPWKLTEKGRNVE